jgi:purine-nucleoside phosphorylase
VIYILIKVIEMIEKINETVSFLKQQGIIDVEFGIVLGTGLGRLVDEIKIIKSINYTDIPNFPVSTVESHSGKLVYGRLQNRFVLAMQGRFHYYEGYDMQTITFPIRVMKELGVKFLLLSNAAGAMNLQFKKASLMLISDHINLLGSNPLIGKNYDSFGPRFPDMSKAYSPKMNQKFRDLAKKLDIQLHEGVYVAVSGPCLETPAEYRFLRTIGADVVGMSTVPEVIVANHMGLPCAAISVLTDECDPDNLQPVELAEIIRVAGMAEEKLTKLFSAFVAEFS